MANSEETKPIQPRKKNKIWIILISILLGAGIIVSVLYFLWIRSLLEAPLGDPLDLPESTEESITKETPQNQETTAYESTEAVDKSSTCSDEDEWLVLVVGSDYREGAYWYGLSDAIRIVRVDFNEPSINVVALPRALLIENPAPRLEVEAPILLNQAYLFGTKGMGHYSGSGYGAGALAETLQTNFGLDFDHYVVMDFAAFQNFIYLIGGVQIDLPDTVYINETEERFFPAGVQNLDGEEALQFARARVFSSDNIRIDNQTLLLKAIFQRLKDPEVLRYLPELIENVFNMILTDGSLADLQTAVCLVDKLSSENITFYNPDSELIEVGKEFIPTIDNEMDVFLWDQDLKDWVTNSLGLQ
jgi:LCP family protein required for cell wall assembly